MNPKLVALAVMSVMVGGLAGLERVPNPEERLAALTPEAANVIQGGQAICYLTGLVDQCPGGPDDDCYDHVCSGMVQCPDNLAIAEHYFTGSWSDNCTWSWSGKDGCPPVGPQFYCEKDELCEGACTYRGGAWRCPEGGLTGEGGQHQDHQPSGNNCHINP
jgi:hypothetical protein